jgi:hypothetical protein
LNDVRERDAIITYSASAPTGAVIRNHVTTLKIVVRDMVDVCFVVSVESRNLLQKTLDFLTVRLYIQVLIEKTVTGREKARDTGPATQPFEDFKSPSHG